jgi:CheY-like chemotaxis protein
MSFLKKVVIGEDDDAVAHLVEATLGDVGYLCLRARDGNEALTLTRSEAPDLLVLDVLMPRMDGIAVVQKLKADPVHSRVPILLLTSLGAVDDRVRGLNAGADDYLPKPFDLRELTARAQSLVRQSRRERDRSPTTNLPGPGALEETIAARLEEKQPFALIFVELDGYDALVAEGGWRRGEAVVADVALGLGSAVEGRRDVRLTHIGGDDFVVVAPAGDADALVAQLAAAASGRGDPSLRPRLSTVRPSGAATVDELARAVARARSPKA